MNSPEPSPGKYHPGEVYMPEMYRNKLIIWDIQIIIVST